MDKTLTEKDFQKAAEILEVDIPTVKAVVEVESAGSGFIADRPKILFEGHIFWRRLVRAGVDPEEFREGYEDVLYERWERDHYRGGLAEYERLEKASDINRNMAYESCSWGLFQIMGYHWESLDYHCVHDFVLRMYQSEGEHLMAFIRYVKKFDLVIHLKNKDFESFSKGYNGPAYFNNKYHIKLKEAYEKYRRELT